MSNVLIEQGMRVLVQGATGREGQRIIGFMQSYFTPVTAGVTPGKGGQEVLGVPVYNSVAEAVATHGAFKVSSICVPPFAVKSAVAEALDQGITILHVLTEGVAYRDLAEIKALVEQAGATLLGPGSLGILLVGVGRIGFLGGDDPKTSYKSGPVSLISRSGGMTNEIAHYLCDHGIGLRYVCHLGSETIAGSSLVDHIMSLDADSETKTIVVFEEVTNTDLPDLAAHCEAKKPSKKIIIALAGQSQAVMPEGVAFGHVDALVKQDADALSATIDRLKAAGVTIVNSYEDFIHNIPV